MSEKIESIEESKIEKNQHNTLIYDWVDLCFHLLCIFTISHEQKPFQHRLNSLKKLPSSTLRFTSSLYQLNKLQMLQAAKLQSEKKLEELKELTTPERELNFSQFFKRLDYMEKRLESVALSQHPIIDGTPNWIPFTLYTFYNSVQFSTEDMDSTEEGQYSVLMVKYETCLLRYQDFITRMEAVYDSMRTNSVGESKFYPDNVIVDTTGDDLVRAYIRSLYHCLIQFRSLCSEENRPYLNTIMTEGIATKFLHVKEHRAKQLDMQSRSFSYTTSSWYNNF
jgi:hypothetical protein